ncbi:MAG: fibronectin type III domain-containing protein [Planctomycetes bacterium]|nr:fibronectin type III domain-containing protein [Planctomycetota bacterium]
MPKFPKKEADILALSKLMSAGYVAHPGDFPDIARIKLAIARSFYKNARDARNLAQSAVKIATEAKNASLGRLKEVMDCCLKKSVVDTFANPEKLALIGWGPRIQSQSSEAPSQPNNLTAVTTGPRSLLLMWDRPNSDSPAVRNYIVERRCQEQNGQFSSWIVSGTAYQTKITLKDQPQNTQLEYRVKAVNASGESIPSNTVEVVL